MFQGLRSIISFGFTNVVSIIAVTLKIIKLYTNKERNSRQILPLKL